MRGANKARWRPRDSKGIHNAGRREAKPQGASPGYHGGKEMYIVIIRDPANNVSVEIHNDMREAIEDLSEIEITDDFEYWRDSVNFHYASRSKALVVKGDIQRLALI